MKQRSERARLEAPTPLVCRKRSYRIFVTYQQNTDIIVSLAEAIGYLPLWAGTCDTFIKE